MRVSTYTRVYPVIRKNNLPDPDYALLVNGLYLSFDVVPARIGSALSQGRTDFSKEITLRLKRRGHLTEMGEREETDVLRFLSALVRCINRQKLYIHLLPTYNCNFRCPYCFESHRLKNGEAWLTRTMPPQTVDAVFKMLQKKQEQGITIPKVNLYGGEPLLKENLELIRYICDHCSALHIPVAAVTNGYDLGEYLDVIDSTPFSGLQVSVDGYGSLTDSCRRHRDGLPTYERIMDNVKKAYAHGIRTWLWINTDRNRLPQIGAILADMRARGLREVPRRFEYRVRSVNLSPGNELEVKPEEIVDALIAAGLTREEARLHTTPYDTLSRRIFRIMNREGYPGPRPCRCKAHNSGQYVIDPFGKVYGCTRIVGNEAAAIGHIDVETAEFVPEINGLFWDRRDVASLSKCRTCPSAMLCGGGCAERAFAVSGNYFSENCRGMEFISKLLSHIVGETWNPGMNEELSLSWAELFASISVGDRERFMRTGSIADQMAILREEPWSSVLKQVLQTGVV